LISQDRTKDFHDYRGGRYSFDELVKLRGADAFTEQITLEARQDHFRRCQVQLDWLADYVAIFHLDRETVDRAAAPMERPAAPSRSIAQIDACPVMRLNRFSIRRERLSVIIYPKPSKTYRK